MMDLAEYLQDEVDKERSIRKTAKRLGISKTTLENIIKRRTKTRLKVSTLENIAAGTGLTLVAVAEMAGVIIGDGKKHARVARELERKPWIAKRLNELLSLNEGEFNYWMDWIVWYRKKGSPPDPSPPSPSG